MTNKENKVVPKLYTVFTANSRKATIILELLNIEFENHYVDIFTNVNREPWYLKLTLIGQVPIFIDSLNDKPITIFESAAISQFIAYKYDTHHKYHYPIDNYLYWQQLGWLSFESSTLAPDHFALYRIRLYGETNDVIINKAIAGVKKQYNVLNNRLKENNGWLVGDTLNIADVDNWAIVNEHDIIKVDLDEFEALKEWHKKLASIPGFQEGIKWAEKKQEEFFSKKS